MKKNKMICARLEAVELELIKKACQAKEETTSSFVRRSMKAELARMGYSLKKKTELGAQQQIE